MTSFNDNMKMLKERWKNRKDAKKYASAADTAVELAVECADENDNQKALVYYKDALACIAKVQHKSDAVLHNEFLAHHGCLKSTYDDPQAKILEALNSFMEYGKRLKDPSHKQIALHVVAFTYQKHLKGEEKYLEKAKGFALDSLEMLRQDGAKIDEILKNRYTNAKKLEDDNSKRRLAGAYQLLASICDEEGDTKAAESFINKALEFERLESDPIFHHTILSTKRKYVSREQGYEISSKMLKLVEKMAEKEREKNMMETQAAVADDCLVRKDFVKTGKTYFLINKKCFDHELKQEAKDQLIKLCKIKERTKEVTKTEEVQPIGYQRLARMYEETADEMLNIGALEGAVDYYKKMKDVAAPATPPNGNVDPEYGDLEISRDLVPKEFDKFAFVLKSLRDVEEKAGIKNHERKADLPKERPKEHMPKLNALQRQKCQKGGVEMFREAPAAIGRKPNINHIIVKPRDSKLIYQNPFEFCRQQNDKIYEPERHTVTQFLQDAARDTTIEFPNGFVAIASTIFYNYLFEINNFSKAFCAFGF
uniref:Uncharacterized protein n=1 Tax=Panagrolaimus davidi TaxID=227884 RepID=A0A914P958_9BILA